MADHRPPLGFPQAVQDILLQPTSLPVQTKHLLHLSNPKSGYLTDRRFFQRAACLQLPGTTESLFAVFHITTGRRQHGQRFNTALSAFCKRELGRPCLVLVAAVAVAVAVAVVVVIVGLGKRRRKSFKTLIIQRVTGIYV